MARWLWCLVVCGALAGCRGSGSSEEEAAAARNTPRAAAKSDGGEEPLGDGLVRTAQRRPDGGMPDGGRFRYELEGVPHPSETTGQGKCPPGTHRCCEGSCSPDKQCPGVACDPVPTMSE